MADSARVQALLDLDRYDEALTMLGPPLIAANPGEPQLHQMRAFAVVVLALAVCYVPGGQDVGVASLRPLGFLTIGLVVGQVVRSRS